jgi:hypothetical protein
LVIILDSVVVVFPFFPIFSVKYQLLLFCDSYSIPEQYETRLARWATDTKQPATASKLVEYDHWLHNELPTKLRSNKFITVEDLGKVVGIQNPSTF